MRQYGAPRGVVEMNSTFFIKREGQRVGGGVILRVMEGLAQTRAFAVHFESKVTVMGT